MTGQSMTAGYFGSSDEALFGWLHLPDSTWSGVRVVLCPPLGYEGLFAHPALAYLAEALATRTGAAVFRFDYLGSGDSGPAGPGRTASWLDAIGAATNEVQSLAPSDGPVVLVGLRAGALLAAAAVVDIPAVDALVLWAPIAKGSAFVREQRAFAQMAVHTATAGPDAGESEGLEANGFHFDPEQIAALSDLRLSAIAPEVDKALVVERSDLPFNQKNVAGWTDTTVETVVDPAYSEMMQPPSSADEPVAATDRIVEFVSGLSQARIPLPPSPEVQTVARVGAGVEEHLVHYDGAHGLFGVLTTPTGSMPDTALLILNNAEGYRVGPHSMNPIVARALAEAGFATFRIDLAGVGDSPLPSGRPEHHPYDLDSRRDVEAASRFLIERGASRVVVTGLCSGAYLAWHAIDDVPGAAGLILLNPQTFQWDESQSLDVSPLQVQYESDYYLAAVWSWKSWVRVLTSPVNVVGAVRTLWSRGCLEMKGLMYRVRAAIPFGDSRSPEGVRIRSLADAGVFVSFVFSDHDPGLPNLRRALGIGYASFVRKRLMKIHTVPGADHSFTPAWATQRVVEILTEDLENA